MYSIDLHNKQNPDRDPEIGLTTDLAIKKSDALIGRV
jgi:hypothetical protein